MKKPYTNKIRHKKGQDMHKGRRIKDKNIKKQRGNKGEQ